MDQHILEISSSLCSEFSFGPKHERYGQETTPLELAILCGSMGHLMASFTVGDDGESLQLEWLQKYTM